MNISKICAASLMAAACMTVQADFIADLNTRFPATQGAEIHPAFPGFYSVVKGSDVVFVRDDLSILINGDVTDLKAQVSLTSQLRDAQKPKLDPLKLNTADAIKFGNGKRKLFVFSDPDCPYCRQLERTLSQLKDVTVYVLPYPLTDLHPNAKVVSESIWCANDKATAWRDYLLLGKKPKAATCANPIEKNIALAGKLQIQGTPAILFEDGTLVPGAISLERLEAQLNASHAAITSKGPI